MKHDSLAHLIPGTAHPGGTPSNYEPPPDAYVAVAKAAVHRELAGTLGFPNAPEEQVRNAVGALTIGDDAAAVDESASWVRLRGTLVLDTASRSWVPAEDLDADARAAGYKAALEERRSAVGREAARAVKVEKKLGVTLGGYTARAEELGEATWDGKRGDTRNGGRVRELCAIAGDGVGYGTGARRDTEGRGRQAGSAGEDVTEFVCGVGEGEERGGR